MLLIKAKSRETNRFEANIEFQAKIKNLKHLKFC